VEKGSTRRLAVQPEAKLKPQAAVGKDPQAACPQESHLTREEGTEQILADLLWRGNGRSGAFRVQVAECPAQPRADPSPLLGTPGKEKRAFPLACGRLEDLRDEIASLAAADLDDEVLVLDGNASAEEYRQYLARLPPRF
jgi:hypothetical protein